jgi:glutamyl-tRNA reductase
MWQELGLVHGKPQNAPVTGSVWRTCVRQIQFLPPGSQYGVPVSEGEFFRGALAHRFLVEVCAGLHSPLLGETEVFGQFRAFRESNEWHPAWLPLLDATEDDVKKIRRLHLKNLGAQSYGSLARKRVPEGEPVVLVGAGLLAKDLAPWLEKNPVTLVVRNPGKREGWWEKYPVLAFEEATLAPANAHWVIAAPVSNGALTELMAGKNPGTLLDFRGEEKFSRPPAKIYFDLASLFGELESVRSGLTVRRNLAMDEAAKLSRQREAAVHHRPFGWEDVFA